MTQELKNAIEYVRKYQHAVSNAYQQLVTRVQELAEENGDTDIIAKINARLEQAAVENKHFVIPSILYLKKIRSTYHIKLRIVKCLI